MAKRKKKDPIPTVDLGRLGRCLGRYVPVSRFVLVDLETTLDEIAERARTMGRVVRDVLRRNDRAVARNRRRRKAKGR